MHIVWNSIVKIFLRKNLTHMTVDRWKTMIKMTLFTSFTKLEQKTREMKRCNVLIFLREILLPLSEFNHIWSHFMFRSFVPCTRSQLIWANLFENIQINQSQLTCNFFMSEVQRTFGHLFTCHCPLFGKSAIVWLAGGRAQL